MKIFRLSVSSTSKGICILVLALLALCAAPPAEALRISLTYFNQDTLYLNLDNDIRIWVGEGTQPFTVTSATGAVRVEHVYGTSYRVVPVRVGTDTVTARDAKGQTVTQAYRVAEKLSYKYTSSHERLVGEAFRFQLAGGVPPYSATPYQPNTITIKDMGNGLYECVLKDVISDLNVRDSKRGALNVRLDAKTREAFVAPLKAQLSIGRVGMGESTSLTVSGGVPPYKVTTNNDGAEVKGGPAAVFAVTGKKPGTTVITAQDSKGASAAQALSVEYRGTPFQVILSSASVEVGSGVDVTLHGGLEPYDLTTSGNLVKISSLGSGKYKVAGVAAGQAELTATDSAKNRSNVKITIKEPPPKPVHLTFSTVSIPIGAWADLTVSGGKPPYTASAADGKAKVDKASDSSFRVTGVAKGTVGITVKDSSGKSAYRAVSITEFHPMKAGVSRDKILTGDTVTLMITYGKPPFTVSANPAIVEIRSDKTYFYNVIGRAVGTTTITVKDSVRQTVTVKLTVAVPPPKDLPFDYKVLNSTSKHYVETGAVLGFVLTGGKTPYSVTTANRDIVSIRQTSLNNFEVRALGKGSATIVLRDGAGKEIKHPLTVVK